LLPRPGRNVPFLLMRTWKFLVLSGIEESRDVNISANQPMVGPWPHSGSVEPIDVLAKRLQRQSCTPHHAILPPSHSSVVRPSILQALRITPDGKGNRR